MSGVVIWTCDVCGKECLSERSLAIHSRHHSIKKPARFLDEDDKESDADRKQKNSPLRTPKNKIQSVAAEKQTKYLCKILTPQECEVRIKRLELEHMRRQSPRQRKPSASFSFEAQKDETLPKKKLLPFGCNKCSQKFRDKKLLSNHMKQHTVKRRTKSEAQRASVKRPTTREAADDTDEDKLNDVSLSSLYKCGICLAGFPSLAALEKHSKGHFGSSTKSYKPLTLARDAIVNQSQDTLLPGKSSNNRRSAQKISRNETIVRARTSSHNSGTQTSQAECLASEKVVRNDGSGAARLRCSVCSSIFTSLSRLQSHILSHSDEELFVCSVCFKSFSKLASLQSHILSHSEAHLHACANCHATFDDIDVLKKHAASCTLAHSGKQLPSSVSDTRTGKLAQTDMREFHVLAASSTTEVVEDAAKTRNSRISAQTPATHTELPSSSNKKQHPSDITLAGDNSQRVGAGRFAAGAGLSDSAGDDALLVSDDSHDAENISPEPTDRISCEICTEEFHDDDALAQHIITHTEKRAVKRKLTNKTESEPRTKRQLYSPVHSDSDLDYQPGDEPDSEEEEEKEEKVVLPDGSAHHGTVINGHHEDVCVSEGAGQKDSLERDEAGRIKCLHCPKVFQCARQFFKHMSCAHAGQDWRLMYTCSHCQSGFAEQGQYNLHLLTHTEYTAFHCVKCSEGFGSLSDLEKHLRTIHSFITPAEKSPPREGRGKHGVAYACQFCEHSCVHESAYQSHMQLHVEMFVYKCGLCPVTFISGKNLEEHVLTHLEGNGDGTLTIRLMDVDRNTSAGASEGPCLRVTSSESDGSGLVGGGCSELNVPDVADIKTSPASSLSGHHMDTTLQPMAAQDPGILRNDVLLVGTTLSNGAGAGTGAGAGAGAGDASLTSTSVEPQVTEVSDQELLSAMQFDVNIAEFQLKTETKSHQVGDSVVVPSPKNELKPIKVRAPRTKAERVVYACGICTVRFKSFHSLNVHVASHTGEKPYPCKRCGKSFTKNSTLSKHVCRFGKKKKTSKVGGGSGGGVDAQGGPHQCVACDKVFARKYDLLTHISANHQEGYKCSECKMGFETIEELRTHEATHEKKALLQYCTECPMTFVNFAEQREHYAVHLNDSKCQHCGMGFHMLDELTKHLELHSTENSVFKCPVCGDICVDPSQWFEHLTEAHPDDVGSQRCPICSVTRPWLELMRHVQKHTSDLRYKCDFCKQRFLFMSDLEEHLTTHAGQIVYKCGDCGEGFRELSRLNFHMRRDHGDDQAACKPYFCDQCGKSYRYLKNLKDHRNIHLGIKPYLCQHCGKSFTLESNLRNHMFAHKNPTRYKCEICGKGFPFMPRLLHHLKTHKTFKPYKCDQCGTGFKLQSTYMKHVHSHACKS